MVLPIVGPISSDIGRSSIGDDSWRLRRGKYKQGKPYNLPLPYDIIREDIMEYAEIGNVPFPAWYANAWDSSNYSWIRCPPLELDNSVVVEARNKARARFIAEVGEYASWAQTLIERQKTLDTLASRLTQLYRFARAVKRGQVGQAYKLLNPPSGRKQHEGLRGTSRNLSQSWLQWWFGIAPILKDIENSRKILETPFQPRRVVGKGTIKYNNHSVSVFPGSFGVETIEFWNWATARVRMQATVWIHNPNEFLFSRMGFTNPFLLGYEVIPFSFIANWFVNLEEWLRQWDEFAGLSIGDSFHTVTSLHHGKGIDITQLWGYDPYGYVTCGRSQRSTRVLGIPDYVLGIRPAWRLSPTRAATAISLLIQQGIK